jgi:hypothetical protein
VTFPEWYGRRVGCLAEGAASERARQTQVAGQRFQLASLVMALGLGGLVAVLVGALVPQGVATRRNPLTGTGEGDGRHAASEVIVARLRDARVTVGSIGET